MTHERNRADSHRGNREQRAERDPVNVGKDVSDRAEERTPDAPKEILLEP